MKPSPTLDRPSEPITPTDLGILDAMDDETAASIVTERAHFIDVQDRMCFAERGMLAEYVEERELWKHTDNPETGLPCHSQNEWIDSVCPFSRSSWYDAKRRWKELEDVPAADRIQIPRSNLIVMQKLSTEVRKDAKVIEAAKNLPENRFIEVISERFPSQHLEPRREMKIKPEESAHKVIEEAVHLAMKLGAKTREEAFEELASNYIEDHRDEYDAMVMEQTA